MEKVGWRTYQPVQRLDPAITYEDFYPTYDWAQDSDGHILLIELPGFVKEDVRVQLDNFGNVTVSGGRRVGDSRYRRFIQVFNIPGDANFESISARFDNGLLYIIMPKVLDPINQQQTGGHDESSSSSREKTEAQEELKGDYKKHGPQENNETSNMKKMVDQEIAKEEGREKLSDAEKQRERKQIEEQGRTTEDRREKADGEGKNEKVGGQERAKEGMIEKADWEGWKEKREKFGGKGEKRVKFGEKSAFGDESRERIQEKETEQETVKVDEKELRQMEGEKTAGEERKEKAGIEEKRDEPGGRERLKEEKRAEGEENKDLVRERIQRAEAGKCEERGERKGENSEKDIDYEGLDEGIEVRRIWERVGWKHTIGSNMVQEIITNMKRNKMTVASALVALSVGLYIAQKFKSASDST